MCNNSQQQLRSHKGFATLPTVIILSLLILVVVLNLAAVGYSENVVSSNFSQSTRALSYAESGARDALQRLARNKNFTTSTYTIEFSPNGCSTNEGCAIISVSSSTNPKIITSQGRNKTSLRTVQVNVVYDGTTSTYGEIQSIDWQENSN